MPSVPQAEFWFKVMTKFRSSTTVTGGGIFSYELIFCL